MYKILAFLLIGISSSYGTYGDATNIIVKNSSNINSNPVWVLSTGQDTFVVGVGSTRTPSARSFGPGLIMDSTHVKMDFSLIPNLSTVGLADVAGTGDYNDLLNLPTLGTAAAQNTSFFATAAQGSTADSALQPNGNGGSLTGLTKTQVGLSNVENTAVSTWSGSSNLVSVGTVTSGTWQGTPITNSFINSVAWSKITSTPTTLSGYAITDAYPLSGNPSGFLVPSDLVPYLSISAAASTYQPLDSDLTAIAALSTTSFGRSLLTQANASAARSTLGAGTSNFDGQYSSLTGFPTNVSTFTNDAGYLTNITGKISAGTNVSVTGSGTSGSPYVVSSTSAALSFSNPSRSLNSAFQPSTTRNSMVSYTVDISCTISLTTGQTGTVILEYADDSGFTTNVITVQTGANGNTGTLTIGLNLTQTYTCTLSGVIPINKYTRLRTVNTTGTPTFTFRNAQEVLF